MYSYMKRLFIHKHHVITLVTGTIFLVGFGFLLHQQSSVRSEVQDLKQLIAGEQWVFRTQSADNAILSWSSDPLPNCAFSNLQEVEKRCVSEDGRMQQEIRLSYESANIPASSTINVSISNDSVIYPKPDNGNLRFTFDSDLNNYTFTLKYEDKDKGLDCEADITISNVPLCKDVQWEICDNELDDDGDAKV